MRRSRILVVVAATVGLAAPLFPAPAAAIPLPIDIALLSTQGSTGGPFDSSFVSFASQLEHPNQMRVTVSADRRHFVFSDPGVLFIPGSLSCTGGLGRATCFMAAPVARLHVFTGQGNDRVDIVAPDALHDTLEGGPGDDVLNAGPGSSLVIGGAGNDVLRGTAGNDQLHGEGGGDDIGGGAGNDTAFYSYAAGAVHVTMDELANDGAGELDNVRNDVETVSVNQTNFGPGSDPAGGDSFVGDGGPNGFNSDNPPASIQGLGGDDHLQVSGVSTEVSTIDGGEGNDRLTTRRVPAVLSGGPGNDVIHAAEGGPAPDQIDCGDGIDEARVDPEDVVSPNCETVIIE